MAIASRQADRPGPSLYPGWRGVFFTGLLLWLASVAVTMLTSNVNMIPTIVLLGSFLVPVTAVVWYLDHDPSPTLTPRLVFNAFVVGGVLGVLAASLLESWLVGNGVLQYVAVGLIEEFAKLLALLVVARRLAGRGTRDGIVLGAAVGFGFAALESSGYAFTALLVLQGPTVSLSLGNLVSTELARGVLAPVGHGLWTGILGGALFHASRNSTRLRLSRGVWITYLFVSLLHALWDSMRGIAIVITTIITATHMHQVVTSLGKYMVPTPEQVQTFDLIDWGGLVVVALIGLVTVRVMWWHARREPLPATP